MSPAEQPVDKVLYVLTIPLTFVLLFGVFWPLRNIALVYWVYGRAGYIEKGIRVVGVKHGRFTTGEPLPAIPDMLSGFGTFILAGFTAMLLAALARHLYFLIVPQKSAPDGNQPSQP